MANRELKKQQKTISRISHELAPSAGDLVSWEDPCQGSFVLVNDQRYKEQTFGLTVVEPLDEELEMARTTSYVFLGRGAIKGVFRFMGDFSDGVFDESKADDAMKLQHANKSVKVVDNDDYSELEGYLLMGKDILDQNG